MKTHQNHRNSPTNRSILRSSGHLSGSSRSASGRSGPPTPPAWHRCGISCWRRSRAEMTWDRWCLRGRGVGWENGWKMLEKTGKNMKNMILGGRLMEDGEMNGFIIISFAWNLPQVGAQAISRRLSHVSVLHLPVYPITSHCTHWNPHMVGFVLGGWSHLGFLLWGTLFHLLRYACGPLSKWFTT